MAWLLAPGAAQRCASLGLPVLTAIKRRIVGSIAMFNEYHGWDEDEEAREEMIIALWKSGYRRDFLESRNDSFLWDLYKAEILLIEEDGNVIW